jgi:hypothetical protein
MRPVLVGAALLLLSLDAARAADPPRATPSVTELQRRAVRAAGLEGDRVASMRRRLRLSALAPTISLRGGRGATDLVLLSPYDGSARIDRGDTWRIDGALSWSLERLVWHPGELALEHEAQRRAERRELLTTEVAQLYFERLGLERALQAGVLDPGEQVEAELRVQELTAILDGLTGGAR